MGKGKNKKVIKKNGSPKKGKAAKPVVKAKSAVKAKALKMKTKALKVKVKPNAKSKVKAHSKTTVTSGAKNKAKSAAKTSVKATGSSDKKVSGSAPVQQAPSKKTLKNDIDWNSKLSPLADKVVVIPEEPSLKTSGGIIIPDTANMERPLKGRVVAVGNGGHNKKGRLRPLDVQVGDNVFYNKFGGTEVVVEGHQALILKEEDILGIIG